MFRRGRATGSVGLPVGADVGRGILPLSCSQQRRSVVDERLPAFLPEVDDVLGRVLLQVGEPAETRTHLESNKQVQGSLKVPSHAKLKAILSPL